MVEVTLKEMLEELIKCILEKKERPTFYWKCEYYSNKPEYLEITQVDLLDSRFKTCNDDFSEYEWELENSKIYKAVNKKETIKEYYSKRKE